MVVTYDTDTNGGYWCLSFETSWLFWTVGIIFRLFKMKKNEA